MAEVVRIEAVGDLKAVPVEQDAWDMRDANAKSVGVVYKHHGEYVFNGNIQGFSQTRLKALSKFVARVNK